MKSHLSGSTTVLMAATVIALLSSTYVSAASLPVQYVMEGRFTTVWDSTPPGPFDDRNFVVRWTVPDPSMPDCTFCTSWDFLSATLSIEGIGVFKQDVSWTLTPGRINYSLGPFLGIRTPEDISGFGICGGGACLDPLLWNQDPLSPELFTGVFPLGLDSSCAGPAPCLNATMNYSDGSDAYVTPFVGTLTATTIPIPPSLWLFSSGLFGLIEISRRKNSA